MTAANRFSKPVAFNRTRADDQKILKHVARRNFSGYVKKLILADIAAKESTKTERKTERKKDVEIKILDKNPEFEESSSLAHFTHSESTSFSNLPQEEKPLTSSERLEQMKRQIKKTDTNAGPKMFINRQ